jgi:cell division protein YceG involved in septum cleavage
MTDDLILLCCVENCLLFCPDNQKITKLIQELRQTFIIEKKLMLLLILEYNTTSYIASIGLKKMQGYMKHQQILANP